MKANKEANISIQYQDFLIEPEVVCRDRFNLYRTGVTEKGTNIGKPTKVNIGYGYKWGEALFKIASIQTSEETSIVGLQGYIDAYQRITDNLLKAKP